MKTIGLAVSVALVFLVGARAGDDDVVKAELASVQGKWRWTNIKLPITGTDVPPFTVEFMKDGKTVKWVGQNGSMTGMFEVNPHTKPKSINFFPLIEGGIGVGIYNIEKGVMTLCLTACDKDGRPSEFATQKGKHFFLVTAERVK